MAQTNRVSKLLHSIIFDAWDRGEISDAEMEEIAEMLGSRNYEQQTICVKVAQKIEGDLKFEQRMAQKREALTL